MKLMMRRLVSPLLRFTTMGMTACHHCGWSWWYAKPHCVSYDHGRAIFFCCEWCWPKITHDEQVQYAGEVVFGRRSGWRYNQPWDEKSAQMVMDTLKAGAA